MIVHESDGLSARCEGSGRNEQVNLALTGPVGPGTHILVHLGSAIRILDPQEAALIGDAIRAVDAAAHGEPFDHLIADLIDREPELPPHLAASTTTEGGDDGPGIA